MPIMEAPDNKQVITFMLKCMNPKFFKVVLNPPTEGHAAAHVPVLSDVVLYKDCSCLRAVKIENNQSFKSAKLTVC